MHKLLRNIKQFVKDNFLIIFILSFSAFIRFSTLNKLMVFTPDEEYLIYLANTIIKNFHIIWIGVSSLGFDLYMGPFWIYIISPLLIISKGDPTILGYFSCLFGVFTSLILYLIGKTLFNKKVGIIASTIYSASPLIIYYDQKAYPSAVPFLSILIFLTIYMTKKSKKWWIVFAMAYGMVFHLHLSLILLIFVAGYWALTHKKTLDIQTIILSILAFLLTVSPLIVFDYFHKGSNITTPIRIIKSTESKSVKIDIKNRIYVLTNALGRVLYLSPNSENADEILYPCTIHPLATTTKSTLVLKIFSVSFIFLFLIKRSNWKKEENKLVLSFSLAFLIPFLFLPIVNPVEYYLLGFFPIFFLIIAQVLESIFVKNKLLLVLIIVAFIFSGINNLVKIKGNYGMNTRKELIKKVINITNGETFELIELGACHQYSGWRYLFTAYGTRPVKSSEDSTFSWLYPDEISNTKPQYSVTINETRSLLTKKLMYTKSVQVGGFTAYILEE